ncbi:hypothetical protein [Ellagibacter isourolithinifaciens]|uniref:hypothetical protein n=1 Tax=Ellagibacter isourolithinifaciens TaxID=2137581 RepID=UPI003A8D1911
MSDIAKARLLGESRATGERVTCGKNIVRAGLIVHAGTYALEHGRQAGLSRGELESRVPGHAL